MGRRREKLKSRKQKAETGGGSQRPEIGKGCFWQKSAFFASGWLNLPILPPGVAITLIDSSPTFIDWSSILIDCSPTFIGRSATHIDPSSSLIDRSPILIDCSPTHIGRTATHIDSSQPSLIRHQPLLIGRQSSLIAHRVILLGGGEAKVCDETSRHYDHNAIRIAWISLWHEFCFR